MILTIGGTVGSGKGTVGKLLAEKLGYRYYSMGDVRRKYAEEKGMTLAELNEAALTDDASDKMVDEFQTALAKKEDDFIMESRLGYFFIPDSLKIFLTADIMIRAERIHNDNQESRKVEQFKDVEEAIEGIKKRQANDTERYTNLYQTDCYDSKNFDLIIDTGDKTPEEIVNLIIEEIERIK